MVIGWICSHDLFKTSWEGLHEVLPIVTAEECRMFFVCPFIASVTTLNSSCRIPTYTLNAGDHGELFWSSFWLR